MISLLVRFIWISVNAAIQTLMRQANQKHFFDLGCVDICCPVLLVLLFWTRRENMFSLGSLIINPKDTKQKAKDTITTWLDNFSDVYLVNFPNTQNNSVCWAKCAHWTCVHMVVFLPACNTEELIKCVEDSNQWQEFLYCTHGDPLQGDDGSDKNRNWHHMIWPWKGSLHAHFRFQVDMIL